MLPKDRVLAAILSAIVPGFGQFYCRQWLKGSLFLAGFLLTAPAFPIGTLLSVGIWVWGVVDAYRTAGALQEYPTSAEEAPAIDVTDRNYPVINVRRALPYVGIPLAVVVLLVLVAGLVTFRRGVWGPDGSRERAVSLLVARIEDYKTRTGSYPIALRDLINPTDPIEKKKILDPWGNPYVYTVTGGAFRLLSSGRDGQPGTKDDVPYYP